MEDARIKRTKESLIRTFGELLSEQLFENITINEICDRAGIRRATFYKHFNDKFDFLAYYIRSLREKFARENAAVTAPDSTNKYFIEYAREFINFLDSNEDFVNNVLKSSLSANIISIIVQENIDDTKRMLNKSISLGLMVPASVETTASMLTGGVATVILIWWAKGRQIPKDKLLEEISSVIESVKPAVNFYDEK